MTGKDDHIDFEFFKSRFRKVNLTTWEERIHASLLRRMSFEEKAKVFVNTFKDFNRDQQNEVLQQILLACQVCLCLI